MWFIFALITGVLFALNSLLVRNYAKTHSDSWILSFSFSFFCSLIILPFFLYEFKFTNSFEFWGGVLLIGVVVVLNNIMGFIVQRFIGVSTQNVIGKIKLIWLIIIGFFLFNETLSLTKILGIILIIAASLLIIDYDKWKVSKKGIVLIILGTITSTIYAVILKKLTVQSGPLTLTFLVFFIPMLINALIIPDFFNRLKKEYSDFKNIKLLFFIGIAGAAANLFLIKALSYSELSGVYLIMESSLIIIIFGEHFILKEREHITAKILAICFAILGAILIRGLI